jgi:alpha-D-ribose 1-methylphosphonate 5-triphosphate diphosphatase
MTQTKPDHVFANARIVLADRVIEQGWLALSNGVIAEFGEGQPPERGEDIGGDLLMPGLVELHTDHLEAHYAPRPKVHWDPVAAVVSFDGQLATSGITTVLDSLRVWTEEGAEEVDGSAETLACASRRRGTQACCEWTISCTCAARCRCRRWSRRRRS